MEMQLKKAAVDSCIPAQHLPAPTCPGTLDPPSPCSVIFFNQTLTQQALIGTVIALAGTWLYTEASSRFKTKKAPPPAAPGKPASA
jgi:hypothetical protein